MPADIYGTLHPVQEIDVAAVMVRDIYAKRPEPRAATGTTLNMYQILKTKPQSSEVISSKVTFSEGNLFNNAVDKTELRYAQTD